MTRIKILKPCVAGEKPRRKGDEVTVSDILAANLIHMKLASKVGEVASPKLQPWEKARPSAKPEKTAKQLAAK